MCLLASFACCGSSNSSSGSSTSLSLAKKRVEEKVEQKQDQNIQQQQPAFNNLNTINSFSSQSIQQLNHHGISSRSNNNFQVYSSQASLPISMSLSLMDLTLPAIYSSNCSSWAGVEEFFDMDEYEERTAWWLHSASAGNINQKGLEI